MSIAVCMLTIEGARNGNCVPDAGVTVFGEAGAGLSAGVVPSAWTNTRKRASWIETLLRMFLRPNRSPVSASTMAYQS